MAQSKLWEYCNDIRLCSDQGIEHQSRLFFIGAISMSALELKDSQDFNIKISLKTQFKTYDISHCSVHYRHVSYVFPVHVVSDMVLQRGCNWFTSSAGSFKAESLIQHTSILNNLGN